MFALKFHAANSDPSDRASRSLPRRRLASLAPQAASRPTAAQDDFSGKIRLFEQSGPPQATSKTGHFSSKIAWRSFTIFNDALFTFSVPTKNHPRRNGRGGISYRTRPQGRKCANKRRNYNFGPAATSDLPSSLPVNFAKFLMKRPARSSALVFHSAASL